MQITVFGASGNIGRLVVPRLLDNGHTVVAFIYGTSPFNEHERLKIVSGDVHDPVAVRSALQGSDAVISTLGSWHTKTKDILTAAMTHAVPIAEELGIKRFITLTGADARLYHERPSFWQFVLRPVFLVIAAAILRDGERHMELLRQSKLDWTTVRSPVMRSKGTSGAVKVNMYSPRPWETIHREDVADALVGQLTDRTYVKAAPYLHCGTA